MFLEARPHVGNTKPSSAPDLRVFFPAVKRKRCCARHRICDEAYALEPAAADRGPRRAALGRIHSSLRMMVAHGSRGTKENGCLLGVRVPGDLRGAGREAEVVWVTES